MVSLVLPPLAADARAFAIDAHGGQRYGEHPYVVHLDEVVAILHAFVVAPGPELLVIGYLHDVVEDTPVTLTQVGQRFGEGVARCVDLLTDAPGRNRKERKAATYARLAEVPPDAPEGRALVVKAADRLANARRCVADDSPHFPRTDPAVIMTVVDDDDRLLLARGRGFTTAGMSVLAGFVEPGESLAAAVAREVHEEVGVSVDQVEYLGDQPWPFPSSLMVGFRAHATSTALSLQDDEIESARWFTRAELVADLEAGVLAISGRLSIARRLIEEWFGGPIAAPEATLRR